MFVLQQYVLIRNAISFWFAQANDRLVHMQSRVNKHFAEWYADVLRLEQNEKDLEAVAFLRDDFGEEVMNDLAPNATPRARAEAALLAEMYTDEAVTGYARHMCALAFCRCRL